MKIIQLLLFLFSFSVFAQTPYTLKGVVLDEHGTPLKNVNIYLKENPEKGVSTNAKGFFELKLTPGQKQLIVSYLGYEKKSVAIDLNRDKNLVIKLKKSADNLDEIVISFHEINNKELRKKLGVEELSIEKIAEIPMIFGERDILRAVQILPGVSQTAEGNVGFSVHGGSSEQNLILLDKAPVYHPSHLFGFFSVFIPESVEKIKLYKSSIPASYGNRLSSILDVKTKIGDSKNFHFGGGIGLIAASLFAEGPIQEDKSSFLVAGRRTYADLYIPLLPNKEIKDTKINFYDINTKLNFNLSKKSVFSLSGYKGRDKYNPSKKYNIDWGNMVGSIKFEHLFGKKFLSSSSANISRYDYNIGVKDTILGVNYVFDISAAIEGMNFKQNFSYYLNKNNQIDFGADAYYHTVKPGDLKSEITGVSDLNVPDRNAGEIDVYAMHHTKILKILELSYGGRYSMFSRLGPGEFIRYNQEGEIIDTISAGKYKSAKTYRQFAPRIAINLNLSSDFSIKASYDKTFQFLHFLTNDATTSPTDIWIPSSVNLKPQESAQYSFGLSKSFAQKYLLSVGYYYRDIKNITDYRTGTTLSLNPTIERDLVQGIGRARGLEFLLKKSVGNFTGSVAYTYAKSEKKIDVINDGNWYPASQDRTHDINIMANYKFNNRMQISAFWTYYTGRPITYPAGTYQIDDYDILFFSHRNANRMPDYHRLDLSFIWKNKAYEIIDGKKVAKKFQSSWAFSIYNAYAHANAYMITFKYENDKIIPYKVSLFEFVPSISYHFKF